MGICPKILSIEEAEKIETARRSVEAHAERMKLRDQFAASALSGMLARPSIDDDPLEFHFLCEHAYKWADAMLDARDRAIGSGERGDA